MKKINKQPWTEAENTLLLEYYYTLSRDVLLSILPGRSIIDILAQVSVLTKRNKDFNK